MKRIICVLMSALMLISLFGCAAGKSDAESFSVATTQQETEKGEVTTSADKITSAKADKKAGKKNISKKQTNNESTESSKTGQKKSSLNTTTTETDSNKVGTTAKKTTNKTTTKKTTTTKKATTTSAYITCKASIECSSILSNMDDLKAGHEPYVPSGGIIMSGTSVSVKRGSTAYDAIKQACDSQGITMNVTSSGYGKYIVGFNNIDEKDCGKQSGWKYKVNGTYPSKSCDKYVLNDGDKVEFTFICKY